MNAIPVDRSDRNPRVPFRQPVRVVPLGGPPRAFRVLAGNLSKGGMFLNSDQPFEEGTKVALSLEASGRVLPFAQGEVVWKRFGDGKPGSGFGVRFTGFLHPRAHDMVGYLVKAIESGEPLTVDGSRPHSWKQVALAGAAALIAGAVVTAGFLAIFGGAPDPAEEEAIVEITAPAVVAAPPVESPAEAVAAPELFAEEAAAAAPKVRTIDLAPMVLTIPEPKAVATPTEGSALALPSGAATSLAWAQTGEALTFTVTLAPGARVAKAFLLQNPPRLAIDVTGGAPKKSHVVQSSDPSRFHRVRIGRTGQATTRLVVDLARAGKTVETRGGRITVVP